MTPSKKLVEKALRKGFSSVEEYKEYLDKKSYNNCYVKNRKLQLLEIKRQIEKLESRAKVLLNEIAEFEAEGEEV